ncbi:putative SOS response-associated peptidase YedK [Friedmanniella endophytica]|uniref:Abasic site processing protein n=1 Tax=Microlunatus kandeliicorticis TaxID=1759536 RepID=A0A7W3IUY2_9ACTN|nr:SOS response-associated peptidase [Microlunatus kandeliicorticis]MBA8795595.1 putative SOS response-associated peptidase YedK [Microlunatus kandeliicorticis]
MCGRYASSANTDDLVEEFDIDEILGTLPGPDYNVAPTVAVPAVLERVSRDTGETRRRLSPLTWGLVPSWAKDRGVGARMINARVETIAEKPAFKKACGARRCLLPADGYYEWYETERRNARGKPVKQPFFIRRADGGRLAMAGLYEIWRDPTKDRDDDTAWLRTCTVITTRATDAVGHIHDRMPMVLTPETWDAWLDPHRTDPAAARELLTVIQPTALEVHAVSTEVNSVQNNHPGLVEPIPEEAATASGTGSAGTTDGGADALF